MNRAVVVIESENEEVVFRGFDQDFSRPPQYVCVVLEEGVPNVYAVVDPAKLGGLEAYLSYSVGEGNWKIVGVFHQ